MVLRQKLIERYREMFNRDPSPTEAVDRQLEGEGKFERLSGMTATGDIAGRCRNFGDLPDEDCALMVAETGDVEGVTTLNQDR